MECRAVTADGVEVRGQSVKQNGLVLLLYKNAGVDMNILDETLGSENWQREHYECKGNLFCRVGIFVNGSWVWKSDCGTESNTEAQKGEASDSFKRACFNWGIGRELYTAPFIWIQAKDCNITQDGKCYDRFEVRNIGYTGDRITALEIFNTKTRAVCFRMGNPTNEPSEPEEPSIANERIKPHEARVIKRMLEDSESDIDSFLGYYNVEKVEDMTKTNYIDASRKLNKKLEGKR